MRQLHWAGVALAVVLLGACDSSRPPLPALVSPEVARFEALKRDVRDAPAVDYCVMVGDARRYDGQMVRVTGTFAAGYEWSMLSRPSCDGQLTWIEFDPRLDRLSDSATLDAFERAGRERRERGDLSELRLNVVFIGTFSNGGGFGHLNAFASQLNVLAVASVKPE